VDQSRCWTVVETSWGFVGMLGGERGLRYVGYPEPTASDAVAILHAENPFLGEYVADAFEELASRLRSYFDGDQIGWSDLAFELIGTAFQLKVWEATCSIGYGQTATYAEIAGLAEQPRAARAAGAALATNRSGLLVPCHRVLAANGIGGYGGRPERKRALLELEARSSVSG
jgi:O-6-methylguanine DNA methyltransferase